ncbi:MAG: GNAT family N-acyltransferase [Pseudomonadota bacterium]|nr:GNAT family N-acyltransferase [Pseudomonadota bacterium]
MRIESAIAPQRPRVGPRLQARFAITEDEIREAQRLRHAIFAGEMNAKLKSPTPGLDSDLFDDYCQHLTVIDRATDTLVGYTRILTEERAAEAGGFYSQTEFALERVLSLPGRFMEIGRTCIHPNYRSGGTIAVLWSALADFISTHGYDHLIGCASIPLQSGHAAVRTLIRNLRTDQTIHPDFAVVAKHQLPQHSPAIAHSSVQMPALIRAYLRLGAQLSVDPYWDRDFNVADVLVLLSQNHVNPRYARHFLAAA